MIDKYNAFCKVLLYIGLILGSFVFCLIRGYKDNQVVYATSDMTVSRVGDIDVMNLPKLGNYVVDFSNTLDPAQLDSLNKKASDYDISTSNEFAVVFIPDRQGNELYDIALSIFRKNEIGKQSDNNGLLLVVSVSEKKLRVIVGYGLEGDLPDVLVKQVIETDLRPYLDSGDLITMVDRYYDVFSKILVDSDYKAKYIITNTTDYTGDPVMIVIFMICFFIGLFSSLFVPKLSNLKDEKEILKIQNTISNISLIVMGVVFLSMLVQLFTISIGAIGYIFGAILGFISSGSSGISSGGGLSSPGGGFGGGSFGGGGFGGFGGGSTGGGGAGD